MSPWWVQGGGDLTRHVCGVGIWLPIPTKQPCLPPTGFLSVGAVLGGGLAQVSLTIPAKHAVQVVRSMCAAQILPQGRGVGTESGEEVWFLKLTAKSKTMPNQQIFFSKGLKKWNQGCFNVSGTSCQISNSQTYPTKMTWH